MDEEQEFPQEPEESETPDEEEVDESTSDEEDDSDVDYRAKYEEAKALAEKLENDRKAALGSRKSQQERDELLWSLSDKLEAMEKSNAVLLKALSTGEYDQVADELTKIQKEDAQSRASRQFDTRYAAIYESLEEAVVDDEGNQLLDLRSDSMKDFVQSWRDAYERKDLVDLSSKLAELQAMARKAEREKIRAKMSESKKSEKDTRRKKRQEDADLDLGPASGAAKDDNMSPTDRIARGLKKRGGLESVR